MTIFYLILMIVFLRGISTLFFLISSFRYLSDSQNKKLIRKSQLNAKIVILIPVLREQRKLAKTLDYFLHATKQIPNCIVVIVTTEKEYIKSFDGPATQELLAQYIEGKDSSGHLISINYPKTSGYMAHQLNYAIKVLKQTGKINGETILGIYNADSRPNPRTFNLVLGLASQQNNADFVAQQSAIFLKNFKEIGTDCSVIGALFNQANAILQSRWTLAHEVPRLLRQKYGNSFFKKYANAHCVGHGLFIKLSTLEKVGGFSEETITEDLFLGYLLRAQGITINPISSLELADSPKTFIQSMRQKYIWFWGPMSYPLYFKFFKHNYRDKFADNKLRAIILLFQGMISGIAWLLSGPMILYLIVYPAYQHYYYLFYLSIPVIIIYGPLQSYLVLFNFKLLTLTTEEKIPIINHFNKILISLFSLPVILLHSIPPYFSLFAELKHQIFNQEISKPKTDE